MVLSWTILLPLGMLAARYFKIWPGQDWPRQLDNKIWWFLHYRLQSLGVALMTLAVVFIKVSGAAPSGWLFWHAILGWTICVVGWVQYAGGLLRGSKGGPTDARMSGDHFDMSRRRVIFEHVHKSLGWIVLPLVWAATAIGLVALDAPRWMAIVLVVWWVGYLSAFLGLQRAGRCIDTYQAIWGPSSDLPGAKRRPIGFAVRRVDVE
jgi:hypothetical protein